MNILKVGHVEKLTFLDVGVNETAETIGDELFHQGRICKYCAVNTDIEDQELLKWFHGTCWQNYRKSNIVYPMPKYA